METERLIEIIQNEIKKDKEQSLKDVVNILLYCFQMPDGDFKDRLLIEFVKSGKKGLKMIYPLIVYDSDGNYNIEIKNMFGDDAHDTK